MEGRHTEKAWGDTVSSILQFCLGLALFSSYDLWLWEIPKHLHDFTLSSSCFLERFKYIWTAVTDTKFCLAWKYSRIFSSDLGDYLSPHGIVHDISVKKFTMYNHLQIWIKWGMKTQNNILVSFFFLRVSRSLSFLSLAHSRSLPLNATTIVYIMSLEDLAFAIREPSQKMLCPLAIFFFCRPPRSTLE